MTSTTTDRMDNRFDVVSPGGVTLGVWVSGDGPPLVLVHGSITDHSTFNDLVEELRDDVTTYAVDRRGFGVSGDVPEYSIEGEFEDIATVVDAVADRTGGPVALFGHSYGANSAMGAATLTGNVRHLMLYEPSLGMPGPPGSIEVVEAALARGDHEGAILEVLVGQLELTMEEVDALRASPDGPVSLPVLRRW
jgi:pimeloyl-ACP methyl ester carboxylesterase